MFPKPHACVLNQLCAVYPLQLKLLDQPVGHRAAVEDGDKKRAGILHSQKVAGDPSERRSSDALADSWGIGTTGSNGSEHSHGLARHVLGRHQLCGGLVSLRDHQGQQDGCG